MAWFGTTLASADMVRHNLGEMVQTPAPGAYSIRASEEQMALRGKTIGETFTDARAKRARGAPARAARARGTGRERPASACCFLKGVAPVSSRARSLAFSRAREAARRRCAAAGEFRAPGPGMYDPRPRRKCRRATRTRALRDPHRREPRGDRALAERDGVDAVLGPGPAACVSRCRARARAIPLSPSLSPARSPRSGPPPALCDRAPRSPLAAPPTRASTPLGERADDARSHRDPEHAATARARHLLLIVRPASSLSAEELAAAESDPVTSAAQPFARDDGGRRGPRDRDARARRADARRRAGLDALAWRAATAPSAGRLERGGQPR